MITLPSTAFADITRNVGGLVNDLWSFLAILLGIVVGFFILEAVVSAVISWRHDRPQ